MTRFEPNGGGHMDLQRDVSTGASDRYTVWLRNIEHAKELIGSGVWQAKALNESLPSEFEDAWKLLFDALADRDGQVWAGIDVLARVPMESGQEIGEMVEERRAAIYAR